MKTSEFIERVEKLGFIEKAKDFNDLILVQAFSGLVCMVSKKKLYSFNTFFSNFEVLVERKKAKLMEIVIEYAATPIEQRKDKTIEEKTKEYIQSYIADNLSFESARDFLECCHLYFNDEDKNRKYLIDAHLSNYSQERLKECSEIYDWYHENSTEFIRIWLEVAEHE